jgi:hypothetical protein
MKPDICNGLAYFQNVLIREEADEEWGQEEEK